MPSRRHPIHVPYLVDRLRVEKLGEDGVEADPKAITQSFNEIMGELHRYLRYLQDADDAGLPAGAFEGTPTDLEVGAAAILGDPELGWIGGGHTHGIPAGSPALLGPALSDGVGLEFSRNDHVHKRDHLGRDNDVDVGVRGAYNFVDTATLTWTLADDAGSDEVEVTGRAIGTGFSLTGPWTFRTGTTTTPTSGRMEFDNADVTLVTNIYLNEIDADGDDRTIMLDLLEDGMDVLTWESADFDNAALFQINGVPSEAAGVWTIPVTYVADQGAVPWSQNTRVTFASMFIGSQSVNLQQAYDAATAVPQITVANTLPLTIDLTAAANDVFALRDEADADLLRVSDVFADWGPSTKRVIALDLEGVVAGTNGNIQFMPDDYTQTGLKAFSNVFALQWSSTITSIVPGGGGVGNDQAPGMVGALGELILQDQGNLFSTAILFSQGTVISCDGFNSGPSYTMVNQPLIRNIGGGSATQSQANAVRSQQRVGPNVSGNITLVSHEPYYATAIVNATVGTASITTLNYFAAKGPIFTAGGTVGTLHCFDIVNIAAAGIGTLVGLNSAMASGTFINHTGIAPSVFAGDVRLNDDVSAIFGDSGGTGVELFRSGASTLTMQGFGATFNEGLDFNMEASNNIRVTSGTGASLNFNFNEFAFGTGVTADGTNNWVMAFAPGLRATQLAGDYSEVLFTSSSSIAVAHAITNFATWTVNAPGIVIAGGSIVDAANVLIQTNMAEGTNRYGLLITSDPSGGTLNYALRCTAGDARFDGRVDINNGIALGGGAAATLGTIGGAGPTVAAQAQWVEIDVGGTAHWLPAWT